ncbi:MAG: pyridoxal phosphate-dependent aminotransferase [Pseudomonadota bacterium]
MTDPRARRWANRLAGIQPFHVMALLGRAQAMEAAGRDIIHLEVGEPDFPTPPAIVAAGQAALAAGATFYTPSLGLPALRTAIAGWYRDRFGVEVRPEQVVVTPGASGALLLALALVADPHERVLLADPGYPCNRHFLTVLGAAAQTVAVDAAAGFQLTAADIDREWRDDTVAALIATPANPTGGVLGRAALAQLASAVRARRGHLLVDEIYQGLNFGTEPPFTALAVDADAIVLNSFSKFFGMTGWRVGWLVAPPDAEPELAKLAQNLYIAAPTLAQHAALAAFRPDTLVLLEERRTEFARRRDFLVPALEAIGFRIPVRPEGAFYVYADVSAFTGDSYAFCERLLEQEGVAITPGIDFGERDAQRYVRFACTRPVARLEEAVNRIARFVRR